MPPRKHKGKGEGEATAAPRKKTKHQETGVAVVLNVALTGAQTGQMVQGLPGHASGVLLEVTQGAVPAVAVLAAAHTEDALVAAYQRAYGLSTATATLQVRARVLTPVDTENHFPMGSGCPHSGGVHSVWGDKTHTVCACVPAARFRILQPGAWSALAEEHGTTATLMQWVLEGTEVTWRAILQLFGNRTLMLRCVLFAVVPGPREMMEATAGSWLAVWPTTTLRRTYVQDTAPVFNLTVPQSAPGPRDNTAAGAYALLYAACPDIQPDDAQRAYRVLAEFTPGALKSAMQKIVRLSAQTLRMPDGHLVPAAVVAALAGTLLLLHPGGFVPELQLMTRGYTAALKRTAVICVEDSWVGTSADMAVLLGIALVAQTVPQYIPDDTTCHRCIRLLYDATDSRQLLAWRQVPMYPGITVDVLVVPPAVQAQWHRAAQLLHQLKSFPGDLAMVDRVAHLARTTGQVPVWHWDGRDRLTVTDVVHVWDQHVQRGIAHVLASAAPTFAARFRELFDETTGQNPRWRSLAGFAARPAVQAARFAQHIVMRLVVPALFPRVPLPEVQRAQTVVQQVPMGVLAAAVGPVPVTVKLAGRAKRDLLVVLGTVDPEAEIVMLAPSRAPVDSYFDWGDSADPTEVAAANAERDAARAQVRAKTFAVRSPLLPTGHYARFQHGHWTWQAQPWRTVVAHGLVQVVPQHAPPDWLEDPAVVGREAAMMDAVQCVGTGWVVEAARHVATLCTRVSVAVVLRAHAVLRQQFERVHLPVPALDGSVGSDQLQAYPGDWEVWRFLVLLSRLVPGALRPDVPPRFTVPRAALLVVVLPWLWAATLETVTVPPGPVFVSVADPVPDAVLFLNALTRTPLTGWHASSVWRAADETAARVLRPHQREACTQLQARAARGLHGHFLVMGTGHGKTYTALAYILHRVLHTPVGRTLRHVLWITPPGGKIDVGTTSSSYQLINNLIDELYDPDEALIPVPVRFIDKHAPHLEPFTVSVVHYDYLRDPVLMAQLLAVVTVSFIVFDEVDELYSPGTQRTSNALRLAALCPEFIAQTATPVPGRGKIDALAQWLSYTEDYPVTPRNYLVAACNMVAVRILLPVRQQRETWVVPVTIMAQQAFQAYRQTRDWRTLFTVVRTATNPALAARGIHWARQDRQQVPTGGCFVVCEGQDHVLELQDLVQRLAPDLRVGGLADLADPAVAVVCVSKRDCRGYNTGVRLGAMVRQPYPGTTSQRKQMDGRIHRLTQERPVVVYDTVYMDHTLMALLYERQMRDDTVNYSLEALAMEFDSSVMEI